MVFVCSSSKPRIILTIDLVLESYITHVRIIEDAHYPSTRPPPEPSSSKKNRTIIISVRKSGRVRVHKARENANGTFQIGKTWNLDELTQIENDVAVPTGFIMVMGKPYYWNTNSQREKTVFMNSTIRIFSKYTGGKSPNLVGFDNITSPGPSSPSTFSAPSPRLPAKTGSFQDAHMHAPPIPQSPPVPNISGRRPSIGSTQRSVPQLKSSAPVGSTAPTPPAPTQPLRTGPSSVPHKDPSPPQAAPKMRAEEFPRQAAPLATAAGAAALVAGSAAAAVASAPTVPSIVTTQVTNSPPKQASSFQGQPPVQTQSKAHFQESSQFPTRSDSPPKASVPVPAPTLAAPTLAPTQPQIPTIILNNDPSQRPVSFASSVRDSLDAKNNSASQDKSADVQGIPEQESEESLRDLADNVIYDTTNNHRSSIQGIKVFARKGREAEDHEEKKPKTAGIKFQIQEEDGTNGTLNDNEVFEDSEDEKPASEEDAQQDPENEDNQDASSLSNKGLSFMAPRNAYIVEETLEELNWTGRTDAKTLELNISHEIAELEAQNLHNVVDLDDKLDELHNSMASAINECEKLDTVLAFFSVQLGSFGDEIAHIEGQGEGLQVQTRNQKVLWTELNNILHTVSLPSEALAALETHGFNKTSDIATIEKVLVDLYNAVKAVKSSGNEGGGEFLGTMRALKEKRHIYEQAAAEFMSKYKAFLDKQVSSAVASAENAIVQPLANNEPKFVTLEDKIFQELCPTSSITLFVKEIDDLNYFSLLRSYQQKVKPYYDEAAAAYFIKWKRNIGQIDKYSDLFVSKEPGEVSMSTQVKTSLKRSGTLARLKSHTEFKDKGERHGSVAGITNNNTAQAENALIANIAKPTPVCGYLVRNLEVIKSIFICQQELLVTIFHLSSFAVSKYPEYVKSSPAPIRLSKSPQLYERVFDIDSDRGKAQDLLNAMNEVFSPLQDRMVKFFSEVLDQSSASCPGVLTAIDVMKKELEVSNQDYLNQLLNRLYDKLVSVWNQYISKQIAHIGGTMISSKKRTGPVFFIKIFPAFCKRIEQEIKLELPPSVDINELGVRAIVDKSYDQLGKTMIHTLQRAAKESQNVTGQRPGGANVQNAQGDAVNDYEDKELLNYHIFMIENMTLMSEGLEPVERNNEVLSNLCRLSQHTSRREIDLYVDLVMHRPVGKFRAFVDDVEQVYKKNPTDNPATKPGLNRSALKKLLLGYDVKELRKGLENLRKRVEKHFSDMEEGITNRSDPAFQKRLVAKIWKFTEARYVTLFNKLSMICQRHYSTAGDSGYVCAVEFTESDITQSFKMYA